MFKIRDIEKCINEVKTITTNYINLCLNEPLLFEKHKIVVDSAFFNNVMNLNEEKKNAIFVLNFIVKYNNFEIINNFFENYQNDIDILFENILLVFADSIRHLTIFDDLLLDYVDILKTLLSFEKFMNYFFFSNKFPIIPSNSNLYGITIETSTLLGILLSKTTISLKYSKQSTETFNKKLIDASENLKYQHQYDQLEKDILEPKNLYKNKWTLLFRNLMKNIKIGNTSTNDLIYKLFSKIIEIDQVKTKESSNLENVPVEIKYKSSRAFSLNLFYIFNELIKPILNKPNLLCKIDLNFVTDIKKIFNIKYLDLVDKDTFFKYDKKSEFGGVSKIYFYYLMLINTSITPLFKKFIKESMTIQNYNYHIKTLTDQYQISILKNKIKVLKAEVLNLQIILSDSDIVSTLVEFFNIELQLLLENQEFIDYWPINFILDYCEFHNKELTINRNFLKIFTVQHFNNYFKFLNLFLEEKVKFSNPYNLLKIIEVILNINDQNKNKCFDFIASNCNNFDSKKVLFKNFIMFFSKIEFVDDSFSDRSNSKYSYRKMVIELIKELFNDKDYIKALKELKNTEEANNFILHLITDLNYFLDESFMLLEEIKLLLIKQQEGTLDEDEKKKIDKNKETVKYYLNLGKKFLFFLNQICENTPDIFNNDEISKKFLILLNYYTFKMSSSQYAKYKFNGIEEFNLEPKNIIGNLINMYVLTVVNEDMQNNCIDDVRSFSIDSMLDIGKTSLKFRLNSEEMIDNYGKLINELNSVKYKKQAYDELLEDYPDEFTCGLTYELMRNPVMLPTSNTTVDYSSIKQHLVLNGETDPFNRAKLAESDIKPLDDLKKKIDEWIADKLKNFEKPEKKELKFN